MSVTAEWDGAQSTEWEPGAGTPGDRHCFPTSGPGLQEHQRETLLSQRSGTRGWWRGGTRLGYGRENPVVSSVLMGDFIEGQQLKSCKGWVGAWEGTFWKWSQALLASLVQSWREWETETLPSASVPSHWGGSRVLRGTVLVTCRSYSTTDGPVHLSCPLSTVTGPWKNLTPLPEGRQSRPLDGIIIWEATHSSIRSHKHLPGMKGTHTRQMNTLKFQIGLAHVAGLSTGH